MSRMQETTNATASHHASWDMSSINSTSALSVEIRSDTGTNSAMTMTLVYSMLSHNKPARINVIDRLYGEILCFAPLILACNPSFCVCMHQLRHSGWSLEPGIKPEDAPSILAGYADLHLPARKQFMTCGNPTLLPYFFSTTENLSWPI